MAGSQRELLKGKQAWGGGPGGGCLSMGCSTPLLILGYLGLMPFLGLYHVELEDFEVIQPFVTAVGLMLFLFGCFFMLSGIRNLVKTVRFRLRRRRHPEEPWLYDYTWRPEGFADTRLSSVVHYFNMCFMFGAFALPWNMFAFHPDMPGFLMIIVGIPVLAFDGIVIYAACKAVYTWIHWYTYGVPYIWFDHFPFIPGESMTVGLGATQETGPYKEITVTLRLIEEIPSKGGSNRGTSCWQEYIDTKVIKDPEGFILGEKDPIPITFDLPEDAHTTCLTESNAWYWELTAEVPTPGIDFKTEFLIPVYRRK